MKKETPWEEGGAGERQLKVTLESICVISNIGSTEVSYESFMLHLT